jgi:putative endonuclease
MRDLQPAVYILASALNGTLYIGVTSNLQQRIYQHRTGFIPGFTTRYGVHSLVYYELHGDMEFAILREKRLKKWERKWRLRLVNEFNPEWRDLWPAILGEAGPAR